MANIQIPENPGFPDVYQWKLDDPVIGGPDGVATRPIRQLTERTANLDRRVIATKQKVEALEQLIESGEIGGGIGGGIASNVYGNAPFLYASDKRELTIRTGYFSDEDIVLDVVSILDEGGILNGRDYYLFECLPDGENKVFKVSLTKTAPSGFNEEDVTLIGGFHTLCVNVGTGLTYVEGGETKNHPLNGFVANDILPASVWCLNHRPHSEPEGMVFVDSLDIWVDIYLQSGSGANTRSVYQGAITRSRQYVDHVEDMFCVRKELLDDGEFAAAMLGSNEQTAVAGASEAGATTGGAGGRIDTAGRRMISIYGVEEGCGSIWHWLRTTSAAGAVGRIHGQIGTAPITYGWMDMSTAHNPPTTFYGPLPQSGGKGAFWAIAGALLAGGHWYHSTSCGSRARSASSARSRADSGCGGRGRSRTRR